MMFRFYSPLQLYNLSYNFALAITATTRFPLQDRKLS